MGVMEGKVVLVTGAANGIGKECALLAAKEGASVVVNDLGGGVAGGDEGSAGRPNRWRRQIRAAGGKAVSNSDSVTSRSGVKRMIEQAMDSVQRPARDHQPGRHPARRHVPQDDGQGLGSGHRCASERQPTMSAARPSIISASRTKARFVLFTSTSGLIGNIGQANYAAAKMGIVGPVAHHRHGRRRQECALQRHRAFRLDAHDRDHSGEGRSVRRARRAHEELHARRSGGAARCRRSLRRRPKTSPARSSWRAETRSS